MRVEVVVRVQVCRCVGGESRGSCVGTGGCEGVRVQVVVRVEVVVRVQVCRCVGDESRGRVQVCL